ncbi:MAG: hypothetical protein IT330_18260 [Anaerolineae bacterium]|nr:hypothetical protein [Anaerolineae bacterium]
MSKEMRTILWLQWRLLRNTVRRGSRQDWGRLAGLGIALVLMLPAFLIFAVGLILLYRRLPSNTAYQLLSVVLSGVLLLWLTTPLAQASLTEPFDLPRLFGLPVRLHTLAVGSLIVNVFTIGFVLTAPLLAGAWVGFAHLNLSLLVNAMVLLTFFALLVVLTALVNDVLDLIAEDRRLRNVAVFIGSLPFIAYAFGQFYYQSRFFASIREGDPGRAVSPWEIIDALKPARFLRFIPSGWVAEAMAGAMQHQWGSVLFYTALLALLLVVAVALHVFLLRQLFFGDLVRWQVAAPRRSGLRRLPEAPRLPFISRPVAARFWALVRVDLLNMQRNPMTGRMLIAPLIFGLFTFLLQRQGVSTLIPALSLGVFLSYLLGMNPGHNQLAILDHQGLGALLLTPIPRAYILAAHNAAVLLAALAMTFVVSVFLVIVNGDPLTLPIALLGAFLSGFPFVGLGNLTSVFLPYKVDLERGRAAANEARTSLLAVLPLTFGMPLGAAPAIMLIIVPWALYKPALIIALPLALAYSLGVYAVTLRIAARGLAQREEAILQAVTEGR